MNIETIRISVVMAVIGFAIAKIPPMIDKIPVPIVIPLNPLETCFEIAPTITLAIPVTIKAKPRYIIKSAVVASGFEITNPDNPIAIAPKIISAIRIPFGVFSWLNNPTEFYGVINLIKINSNYAQLLMMLSSHHQLNIR